MCNRSVMQHSKNIKEHIFSVLEKGDILLIVPPFASIIDMSLGPHLLHALAREKGYKANILYLNMLLASILGIERYQEIHLAPKYMVLGERLFARSAYDLPPLGRDADSTADEAMNVTGRPDAVRLFYHTRDFFNLDTYLGIEQKCNSFIHEAITAITSLDYKIIGCTTAISGVTNFCVALLVGIKKHLPESLTIIGGSNCEGPKAEGIATLTPHIDYIFQGESETAFIDLLTAYSFRQLPSQRILAGKPVSSLDTLPLPDYEIYLKQTAYFLGKNTPGQPRIWYETSRGCWWTKKGRCSFCGVPLRESREKSVSKVAADMKMIEKSYPGRMLCMADDILPYSYQKELLPVITGKDEFPSIGYQVKAHFDLHDLVTLKKAKINAVLPGLESFSTHLLELMHKGITGSQSLLFLRNVCSVGIYCDWFMLWGLPGDKVSDYEEILQILPLIRHIQPPRDFMSIIFTPFAPYFENPSAYNIRDIRPWKVFYAVYPDHADIGKLANYYTGDFTCGSYEHPEIIEAIAAEITLWRENWKTCSLDMSHIMGAYVIYDKRDIFKKEKTHVLNFPQAKEVMTAGTYEDSEARKWALEEKLGVVLDSRYVPLITAVPELVLEFESSQGQDKRPG